MTVGLFLLTLYDNMTDRQAVKGMAATSPSRANAR